MGARAQATTHSFLDGIQMRLTDKYKPQRRVILPPEYVNRLQEDIEAILDLDYDFRLEEQILASYPKPVISKDDSMSSWPSAIPAEQIPTTVPVTSSNHTPSALDGGKNKTTTVPPPRPPPPVKDGVLLNPLLASVSYRPMEPQKAQLPGTSTDTTPTAGRGFRVEDFEQNAANPFDHLELKSLNDMEQLKQVLAKDKESSDSA